MTSPYFKQGAKEMKWNSNILDGLYTGVQIVAKKFKFKDKKKSAAAYTPVVYKKCHEGDCLVFTKGNLSVYAGGWTRGAGCSSADLIVDLANDRSPTVKIVGEVSGFDKSLASQSFTPMMVIKWADFGIPQLGQNFWLNLASDLQNKAKGKNKFAVQFCCAGGHGRTGTALSILAHIFGVNGDLDPISWIRKVYCEETVENTAQIQYVEKICGIEIPAVKGAKTSYTYTSYGSGVKK
jgi:hypothetical protein